MINSNEAMELLDRSGIVLILWSTDPDVAATYISDNISQFGYEPNDFYKGEFTDYWKFVHEDDRERAKNELYHAREKAAENQNHSFVISYRVRCKNGEVRWVEETLMYDLKSGFVLERGFLRDVTNTANIIFHMRGAVEKYNQLLDSVSDLVFAIDKGDSIVIANPAFIDMIGIGVGDSINDVIRHGFPTFYEFLITLDGPVELEFLTPEGLVLMKVVSKKMISGEVLVIAENIGELTEMKKYLEYMRVRDVSSGLYNQNALENYIKENKGNVGYRVVMAKVVDYKNEVQMKGYGYAEVITAKIAEVIASEFSVYDDKVFRSFEDEYVIFTKSPVNNVHIYNANKRLMPAIKLQWGISKRGVNLWELLSDARCNFREYNDPVPSGSIFGHRQ